MNTQRVNEIIDSYGADRTSTLAILQDVQREHNFLPREALEQIAKRLGLPASEIYRLATFFKAFSLHPKGEHIFKVCLGTACHVKGGPLMVEALERALGIKAGSTTVDNKFSLEAVRCLGACALAPIVVVDDVPHGQMTSDAATKLVKDLREGKAEAAAPATAAAAAPRKGVDLSAVPPAG